MAKVKDKYLTKVCNVSEERSTFNGRPSFLIKEHYIILELADSPLLVIIDLVRGVILDLALADVARRRLGAAPTTRSQLTRFTIRAESCC